MTSPVVIAMGADQSRRQPIRSISSLYGDTCQAGIHYPAHVAFTLMGRCDRAGFESAQGRRRAHPAITTDGHRITLHNPACKNSCGSLSRWSFPRVQFRQEPARGHSECFSLSPCLDAAHEDQRRRGECACPNQNGANPHRNGASR